MDRNYRVKIKLSDTWFCSERMTYDEMIIFKRAWEDSDHIQDFVIEQYLDYGKGYDRLPWPTPSKEANDG